MSLQRLVRVIFQDQFPELKIVLNVNDYKQQRAEKLQEIATAAAERVLGSGQPYRFSYMPSNERYIIHSFISESEEYKDKLESVSEGEGSQRYLMLRLKQAE
jgi:predicted RNA-binding protein Jag